MEIIPILMALRRNSLGAFLIGLQIAVTLAIVCNALSIIQQRLERTQRPSGLDEQFPGGPVDRFVTLVEGSGAARTSVTTSKP